MSHINAVYMKHPILVQTKVGAQIDPLHVFIAGKSSRGSASKHYAVMNNVSAISYPECFSHVVISDQNANPAFLKVENNLLNVTDGNWVDSP